MRLGPKGLVGLGRPGALRPFTPPKGVGGGVSFVGALPAGVTYSRTGAATAFTTGGVVLPFATDVAPITDRGLLLEAARTNLGISSDDWSNAAYFSRAAFNITPGQAGSPAGTATATKLVPTTTSESKETYQSPVTAAGPYAYSGTFKAAGYNYIRGRLYGGAGFVADVVFNLATGLVQRTDSGVGTITPLANGTFRLGVAGTATGTGGGFGWAVCADALGTVVYAGDGVSGVLASEYQIEAASTPSSPITTTGAAATRGAPTVTMTVPAARTRWRSTHYDGSTATGSGLAPGATFDIYAAVTGAGKGGLGKELRRIDFLP